MGHRGDEIHICLNPNKDCKRLRYCSTNGYCKYCKYGPYKKRNHKIFRNKK